MAAWVALLRASVYANASTRVVTRREQSEVVGSVILLISDALASWECKACRQNWRDPDTNTARLQ